MAAGESPVDGASELSLGAGRVGPTRSEQKAQAVRDEEDRVREKQYRRDFRGAGLKMHAERWEFLFFHSKYGVIPG